MGRNTQVATENLIRHVINDLLIGATTSVIQQKLQSGEYGKQICHWKDQTKIIKEARNRIMADFKDERDNLRETSVNRILDLFTECRQVGDRSTALKCQQELNKMAGLYEPSKVDIVADVNNMITIDFGLAQED